MTKLINEDIDDITNGVMQILYDKGLVIEYDEDAEYDGTDANKNKLNELHEEIYDSIHDMLRSMELDTYYFNKALSRSTGNYNKEKINIATGFYEGQRDPYVIDIGDTDQYRYHSEYERDHDYAKLKETGFKNEGDR